MRKRMDTKEPSKLRGGLRILSPDMPWLYVLSALVMTLLVEGLARRTPIGGFRFLARNPIGFWVNVGIILLTMLLAMLCPKRIPALSLVGFIWFVLGMTECILLSSRVTPLTAVDVTVFFSVITIRSHALHRRSCFPVYSRAQAPHLLETCADDHWRIGAGADAPVGQRLRRRSDIRRFL